MWPDIVKSLGDDAASGALVDDLLERAGAGFCLVGADGFVVAANRVWLRATGLTRAEAIGRDILDLFPESRNLARSLHARARAGEVVDVPRHRQTLAGRETWWEGSVVGVDLPDGRGLAITAVDVTARVAQEEAVRERATAEARASIEAENAALLDALLENAPLGIGFWDRQLRFRRVNTALAEMNGLPAEAQLGKTPSEALPEIDGIHEIETVWREIMETGEPVVDVEVSGSTPADPEAVRYWRESWYPVRTHDEVIGLGAIIRDVTRDKQAEQLQTLLLGIVGHDIRTPLAVLSNCAELLMDTSDPEVSWAAERIESSVERMREVVDLLLDFTRASHDRLPIHPHPMDLDDLARRLVREAGAKHPDRKILFHSDGAVRGHWDGGRLAQALANLLENAFAHGAADRPVALRLGREDGDAVLEVENGGDPIPASELPYLFEPLRQGRASATNGGGVGLGLFIARAIVTSHGGRVEARSDASSTVFRIRLPDAAAAAADS